VLLAFTGAFLVPVIARAAVLAEAADEDVCKVGELRSSVQDAALASLTSKAEHAPVDDIDDSKAGGMCDDRGACVVAPPRVHPVGNARIQAPRGCSFGGHGASAWIGPGPDEVPATGSAPVLAQHAVLDVVSLVPPASSELGPAFLPVAGGPRVGIARGVERPPR